MNDQITKDAQPAQNESALQLFKKQEVVSKFENILKGGANAYIQSALIIIANDDNLMKCHPQSLVKSALRSATLGLSLDPALRQGFLIPRYDKKIKGLAASFQPHYNGLYNLATRTGKYRAINVAPIHEGEVVLEDVRTGLHVWKRSLESRTLLSPDTGTGLDSGWRDVTAGKVTTPVIGYLGYFKQHDGLEKTVWMTIKEIHEHAQKWAGENYNSQYSAWKDPKKLPTMEMKTVFIALTKFMDLSGERMAVLRDAMAESTDGDALEGEVSEVSDEKSAEEVSVIQTGLREPVKDETWAKFIKFCDEAMELGVNIPEIERDEVSQQEVSKLNNRLWSDIQTAKELKRRQGAS